jgi:hypothetical protein
MPTPSSAPTPKKVRGPNGGKRPGAGRKVGFRFPATLDKMEARELVRRKVVAELEPMIDAQVAHAKGLSYLVTRDKKTGKFIRVTEAMAKVKLEEGEELVEVWEKDPSVQAFTDLLNRALDKPKEQEQEIKITGSADLIAKLHAARARMAKRRDG